MKKIRNLILIFLSIIVALIFCILYKSISIGVVSTQYINPDNTILYIDNKNVFYHIDTDGKIITEKKLPNKENGKNIYYKNIFSDKKGNVYLLVCSDYNENFYYSQWVEKRSIDGKLEEVIYRNEVQTSNDISQIYTINVVGDEICIFVIDYNDKQIDLNIYSSDTKKFIKREYLFDTLPEIEWIKYTETGSVYYIDQYNRLFCLDNRSLNKQNYEILNSNYGYEDGVFETVSSYGDKIYFCDIYNMNFIEYDEKKDELSIVYDSNDIVANDILYEELYYMRIIDGKIFSLLSKETFGDTGFFIKDGENYYTIQYQHYRFIDLSLKFIVVAIISFVILKILFYIILIIKNTNSILTKQLTTLIILSFISVYFMNTTIRQYFVDSMTDEVSEELYVLSQNIAERIDGDILKNIKMPVEIDADIYKVLESKVNISMKKFYDIFENNTKKLLYYNFYITRDDNNYIIFYKDEYSNIQVRGINQISVDSNISILNLKSTEDEKVIFKLIEEEYGETLYCMYGIEDSSGNLVGYVETGLDYSYFYSSIEKILFKFSIGFIGCMSILVIILSIQTKRNLRGLAKLREGVLEVSNSNWGTVIDVLTKDEIGDIADAFNRMSREVGIYMNSIEQMNLSYKKFVSKESVNLLNKKSVSDIYVGESINKNMIIISINVPNFYKLNQTKTSQETFDFINKLYKNISNEVDVSGGIIEKYTDGGVRIIYDIKNNSFIKCSLKIIEKIKNKMENVDINVIVQNGNMMYGVAGTEKKADIVAVSEILNYTYMIKDIANENNLPLVITTPVYNIIENKTDYNFRYIGKIKNKELDNDFIDLYEILDAYSLDIKIKKIGIKNKFLKGVLYFQEGDFKEARKYFIDAIKIDKDDNLSKSYLFLCDRYIKNPPEEWYGYFENIDLV